MRVSIAPDLPKTSLSLMVAPFGASFAYEVFANGQRIGSLGEFDAFAMRSPDVRVLPLPAQTGDLLLAFRVRSVLSGNNIPAETAGSVSFIGQSAAIDNAARLWRAERLARSVPGLLLSAAVAIAALFFLSVPLVTRGATEYFWFGLFVLGSRCFRLLPLYPEGLGIGWMQSFNLAMMTSLLGPTIVYLFCCDPCSSPVSPLRPGSARLRCLRSQSWVPSASC